MFCRLFLLVLIFGGLSLPVATAPAPLGGAFADAYTAFAPLYALFQSYAGYLFLGSEVVLPPGLDKVCGNFPEALADLVAEFREQSGSCVLEALSTLGGLREGVSRFCQSYSEQIEAVARMHEVDLDDLARAAESGFFRAIAGFNENLQEAFGLGLNCFENGEDRWRFDVAFATRTLLDQEAIVKLDMSLRTILLGLEEMSPLPDDLPTDIREAIESLVTLCGRPLSVKETDGARGLAEKIYGFLSTGS
jgi:hypothetical protein